MSQNAVLQSIQNVLKTINTERPTFETLTVNEQLLDWLPSLKELTDQFKLSAMEMVVVCMLILDNRDSMGISESTLFTKLNHQLKMPNYLIRKVIGQLKKVDIIYSKGRHDRNKELQLNEKYEEAVYSGDWNKVQELTPVGLMPFLRNFLNKRSHFDDMMSVYWESRSSGPIEADELFLDKNEHLKCVKFIREHFQSNNGPSFQIQLFLAVLANKVYHSHDTNVNRFCHGLDMPRFQAEEFIQRYIKTGNWEPIKMGLMEISGGEQLEEDIEIELTQEGITQLLPELDEHAIEYISKKSNLNIPLMLPEKIKPIELLFDQQMKQTLNPLKYALSPEVLPKIKQLSKSRSVGVCALLYGYPGTGKTEWCYQLAKEYNLPIFEVNISDIQDKWVGNSEKNARRVFLEYKRVCKYHKKDVILLFNEADALFGKRMDAKSSVDQMNNALKNIFLEEMEKMDGILLATTNLSQSLDPAFERRFLFKFKFSKPTADTQIQLWMRYFEEINLEQAALLAKKFNFSPAQISNIQRRMEIERILYSDFDFMNTLQRIAATENLEDPNDKKVMGF